MSDPNVYQQLGSLQAKVAMLEKGQKDANRKLDLLLTRSERAAAARAMLWKVAAGAGTIGGGLVAVLAVVVQWFTGKQP